MASSVSSERAFSSARITICKRRNWLDGDIVKALQCLKALLQQDITLRFIPSVAVMTHTTFLLFSLSFYLTHVLLHVSHMTDTCSFLTHSC